MSSRIRSVLMLAPAALAGCASRTSSESALNPAGPQATRVADLFWLMCAAVSVAVWFAVMIGAAIALRRRRDKTEATPLLKPDRRGDRRLHFAICTSVGVTIVVLLALLIAEFATARAWHQFGEAAKDQISIQVTGRQWWWEVQYKDDVASNTITTANELVIPVGRTVQVELEWLDVIHSFWVPNLGGKKDLVPGHPSILNFRADRAGTFWGECAEFCGFRHAHMRLAVRALPQAEFDAWLAASRQPSRPPQTESEKRGQQVFLSASCVLCHQINGTMAFGRNGPNLTHVASRDLLAAGAFTYSHENLGKWLADPQAAKPGTQMPKTNLSPDDLRALTDYLDSLK